MHELESYDSVFLTVFLLLLLGASTIEACKRNHIASYGDRQTFLFRGRLPIHSLASNIGATFSLTYFFGAIVIYAQQFQSWVVLTLGLAFPFIALLYRQSLKRAEETQPGEEMLKQRGNLILDLMRRTFSSQAFESICSVLLVIYWGLLIEELAVSRLVFSSIVPGRPLVVSFLLSIICLVIVVYLSYGGFRAVLIADFVQGTVLCSFFAMLAYLVIRHGTVATLLNFPLDNSAVRLSNLGLILILAVAWFMAGIDYFSRFNFDADSPQELSKKRRKLADVSALCIFLVLALGILFSQALSSEIPTRVAPSKYVGALVSYFLLGSAPVYRIIFIVSVHCMIFTTINTILITILQISSYKARNPLGREKALRIILAAAAVASLINRDEVHIIGIFIASLLVLPLFPILKSIFPRATVWLPNSGRYLWWAMAGAAIVFFSVKPFWLDRFQYHFLIPGITLGMTLAGLLAEKLVPAFRRTERAQR